MNKIKHQTMVEFTNGGKMVRMVDSHGNLVGHQYVPAPMKGKFIIKASIAPFIPYTTKDTK